MVSCSSEFQRLTVYCEKKKKSHIQTPLKNFAYKLIACEPSTALTPFHSTSPCYFFRATSRRGTERSDLLLCKSRAAQRFQNQLYARKISSRESRAELGQHDAQASPPCREELPPGVSRVETHCCFPI